MWGCTDASSERDDLCEKFNTNLMCGTFEHCVIKNDSTCPIIITLNSYDIVKYDCKIGSTCIYHKCTPNEKFLENIGQTKYKIYS